MKNSKLVERIWRFVRREEGPTTVEYAILLALLVGMMMASIGYVGDEAKAWSEICVEGLESTRSP